jgi:hypothetical protein
MYPEGGVETFICQVRFGGVRGYMEEEGRRGCVACRGSVVDRMARERSSSSIVMDVLLYGGVDYGKMEGIVV